MGPQSANKLGFDPSGKILSVASNDGYAKILSIYDKDITKNRDIKAHEDGVQAILFDRTAEYLVTTGSGKGLY